jgi:hypothetical protein
LAGAALAFDCGAAPEPASVGALAEAWLAPDGAAVVSLDDVLTADELFVAVADVLLPSDQSRAARSRGDACRYASRSA